MYKTTIASIAVAVLSGAAHAAPTFYFGENLDAQGTVAGAPLTARRAFLATLRGVGVATFDSLPVQPGGVDIAFPGSTGNITAMLRTTGLGVGGVESSPNNGWFNTTGAESSPNPGRMWVSNQDLKITFSTAVSAFGFYGTDIGDVGGRLQITLTDIHNIATTFTVPNSVGGPSDGAALFWGFVDATNSYVSVAFDNTAPNRDTFGFDDMVVGDAGQVIEPGVVPEPGSTALLGLGLAGLVAFRRRESVPLDRRSPTS